MSYPRQLAKRTYIADIIPDPTSTNELIPIRRFPNDITGDETISDPPQLRDNSPIDPFEHRVLASGLRRTSKIEQNMKATL